MPLLKMVCFILFKKLFANFYIKIVVKDIVSKFPIDASKDYALYLKDSGQPLQPTKRLYEFHQLASEKSVVELKVLDPEG